MTLAEQRLRHGASPKSAKLPRLTSLFEFSMTPPDRPVLIGDGVRLQPARLENHQQWAALREASRAHLTAWEPAWQDDEMTVAAFRHRVRSYWRELRNGTGAPLLVFRQADAALVGGASLTNIRYGASRSASIGYWVGAPFTRRGFGRAAVETLMDHAFTRLGLNRIEAACQPDNVASKRLLHGAGFEQEGVARDYLKINGAWRDHILFAVTARAYAARSSE